MLVVIDLSESGNRDVWFEEAAVGDQRLHLAEPGRDGRG